jgi:hypothetical protein
MPTQAALRPHVLVQGMLGTNTTPANVYGSNAAATWNATFMGSVPVHVGIIDQGVQVRRVPFHSYTSNELLA